MNYSYKGKILISTPDISGDIFSRSVVLVIEHNEQGAFGLILNKKNSQMSDKFKDLLNSKLKYTTAAPLKMTKFSLLQKEKR